ncbi:MAG: hypothetical protein K8R45_12725 [Desulfobacterales bacterium]|nr:hypothetical protein [Desulfobacterales bacterium]
MNTVAPKDKTSLNCEIPARLGAVDSVCREIHGNFRDAGKKMALNLQFR